MSLFAFNNAISVGGILALLALGLFLSFRILRFPDLTCDGSYALGACISTAAIHAGIGPVPSVLIGMLAGFCAGSATGLLHTFLKIPSVVSGVLVMTSAYSVNLVIMGAPNLSIPVESSLFSQIELWIRADAAVGPSVRNAIYPAVFFSITGIVYVVFWRFLIAETGLLWRCLGANPELAERNGANIATGIPMVLGVANTMVALSGALLAHYQRFADVNTGAGIVLVGLASVYLGRALDGLLGNIVRPTVARWLLALLLGSILYRLIVAFAYELGLPTSLLNMTTSFVVLIALLFPGVRSEASRAFRQ